MSHFCKVHPTYSAKREPNSLCGTCWTLYFYRCPEQRVHDPYRPDIHSMTMELPAPQHLSSEVRKPKGHAGTEQNG